jgi:aspartoacylase
MPHKLIKKVAIVGGTHGNELTGVYLIKKFQKFPHLIERENFNTLTLLANPKAVEVCRRYIDTDLNRCFQPEDLQNPKLINYEQMRAKQIAQYLHQEKADFIIDLHSSTAHMGVTIILNNDNCFLLSLAGYLSTVNPLVKILQYSQKQKPSYLRSLCELGLAIEVGSVPQGVLNGYFFLQTELVLSQILDYIQNNNQGIKQPIYNSFFIYKQVETIDYPRDEQGELKAMVAPQLKDYEPLYPNSPMFLGFDGQEITYQGNSTCYPVFVAEAAYLEKQIAMCLTIQQQVTLSDDVGE